MEGGGKGKGHTEESGLRFGGRLGWWHREEAGAAIGKGTGGVGGGRGWWKRGMTFYRDLTEQKLAGGCG